MALFSLFTTFITPFQNAVKIRSKIRYTDVKIELGLDVIDTEPDNNIKLYLDAVKDKADAYLGNSFLDISGNAYPIPSPVEAWVLKESARLYNYQHGVEQENAPHIGWIKWAQDIDYSIMSHYRVNPGF